MGFSARTNLSKSFGSNESTMVEWKQSLPESDEIIETAVAFMNAEDGFIFIPDFSIEKSGINAVTEVRVK
jgi:predicted HTH transcriptional regulator